ncbi:hypothetical protein BH09PSE4_BH09PSE4_02880 [soil metagenome]
MTDPRMGDALWEAIERLPRGSGIVFRHYELARADRALLFARVAKIARRRNLLIVRAGHPAGRGEDGVHGGRSIRPGLRTASVHNRREAVAAVRGGADAIFVSPIFATRSHPLARTLGPVRLGLMIHGLKLPIIALGGIDARMARGLPGIYGWAGIDAWTAPDQKRKAVPI